MSSPNACPACGWDPRATDRHHVCTTTSTTLTPGVRVIGLGGVEGSVQALERGPAGVLALVKWRGRMVGQWVRPESLTVTPEAA